MALVSPRCSRRLKMRWLGVKRREILSRHTTVCFPQRTSSMSLYVLGGNLVFALVPGGLTFGSLALFFSLFFFSNLVQSVQNWKLMRLLCFVFFKATVTSQVVLCKTLMFFLLLFSFGFVANLHFRISLSIWEPVGLL